MGSIDSNGIWKYDMSDKVNGWPAWMNLGTNSTSNAIKDLRAKAVYTATSQSDATSKVTALKGTGLTPTSSSPFIFWRTDTKSLWVYDNASWFNTAAENTVYIGGVAYQESGVFNLPNGVGKWDLATNPYSTSLTQTLPITPPGGWTVETYVTQTTGFTLCQTAALSGNNVTMRITQFHNSQVNALHQIGWRLAKAS